MKTFLFKVSILWILCWIYITHVQTTKSSKSPSAPIISGTTAKPGQFPWHVLVREHEVDTLLCSGSLIADKWVLTAAHCLNDLQYVRLEFGTINLYEDGLIKNDTKFYIHPNFDRNYKINDIALIELLTPLSFTDVIKPIDLVSSDQTSNDFVGAETILTGFGQTDNVDPEYSEWLLWSTLEVISNEDCAKAYSATSMPKEEMCTIGSNQTDMSPCDGDSGGALVWKNNLDKFVQIGIASFTVANKCSEFPAGYTRVTSYLDYIHNITGLNFD